MLKSVCVCLCVLAPVVTAPPPPAGEVVKYSARTTDHVVPSQDIQGTWSSKIEISTFLPLLMKLLGQCVLFLMHKMSKLDLISSEHISVKIKPQL